MVVGPEVLMELFECGFKGSLGGFAQGQGYHWCERRFCLGNKCVCVCVLKNAEQAAQLLKRRMKGT